MEIATQIAFALQTFSDAAEGAAAAFSRDGVRWVNRPIYGPADLLDYAVPLRLQEHTAPRRALTTDELLAALDRNNIELLHSGNRYGYRRGAFNVSPRHKTVDGAALNALRDLARKEPVACSALRYYAVAPWLASQLELRGELIKHTRCGVSVWAVCSTDDDVPEISPVLRDVFLQSFHGLEPTYVA